MNVLGVRWQSDEDEEVVVCEQQKVILLNKAAQLASIEAGQSLERALMLAPNLKLLQRERVQEANKLEFLTQWAYRFSSYIHIYNEQTLLLEVGRSLKLFKGLKHLQHLINQELEHLALDAQVGLANTPKAAYLLSHQPQGNWALDQTQDLIKAAKLETLTVDQKTLAKLRHCGFDSLGQVLAIPFTDLGERFGKEFVQYLDQLLGNLADPLSAFKPIEHFNRRVDFSEPINNRQWIDQQIERLLKELVRFIDDRNLVCRAFTWRFYSQRNGLLKSLDVGVRNTHQSFNTFAMLTELRFENAEMQWEFSSIELVSESLFEKQYQSNRLFELRQSQENIDELLDKLIGRLGAKSLYKVMPRPEHLPELINQREPIENSAARADADVIDSSTGIYTDFKDEPLWLLEQPKRLMGGIGGPVYKGQLTLIHGPHRVSSHWWATLHSRDYYIARQATGRLLWVYYDRQQCHWYLHGLFA